MAAATASKLTTDDRPKIEKFDPWEQKFKSHLRPVKIEPAHDADAVKA